MNQDALASSSLTWLTLSPSSHGVGSKAMTIVATVVAEDEKENAGSWGKSFSKQIVCPSRRVLSNRKNLPPAKTVHMSKEMSAVPAGRQAPQTPSLRTTDVSGCLISRLKMTMVLSACVCCLPAANVADPPEGINFCSPCRCHLFLCLLHAKSAGRCICSSTCRSAHPSP